MLIINVYNVLDEIVVSVNTTLLTEEFALSEPTTRNIHYCSAPVSAVSDPQQLGRVITQALEHANGYAGDLSDHVLA